jgi:hypothetical protein
MWARLMANAVDPNTATKPEKVYIDILKSLSSREVLFLQLLSMIEGQSSKFKNAADHAASTKQMSDFAEANWRQFPPEDRAISIQNLVRQRCVTFRAQPIDISRLFGLAPVEKAKLNPFGQKWALVDPNKFQRVLQELVERQLASSGMMDFPTGGTSTKRLCFAFVTSHKLDMLFRKCGLKRTLWSNPSASDFL